MKKILLSLCLLFATLFSQEELGNALYKADINSHTAYDLQQKGALLIDVRTKREFEYLHSKGAINIPVFFEQSGQRVFNQSFIEQVDYAVKGNHDKEIILICRSGSRTKFAANLLANEGFSNVYNILQGFAYDWSKTDLPVEK